ncbi:MAG: CopG family transcriptional regulator [Patescibacteria group bacterium]|jgi:putative iron-only hydrogenase system regulator
MSLTKQLGTISILMKDRHSYAVEVQEILTEHGNLIMARMGVNPARTCVKNCTGIITIIVEGTTKEINDLTKKLDKVYGVVAKSVIITK